MGTSLRWRGRIALVTVLALTACTSKPEPGPKPTPNGSLHAPSTGPSSPDPHAQVQAAVTAYVKLLNAYAAASNAGTTDTTELARYGTGSALQLLSNGLADNKTKGLHTQGAPGITPPQVTEISPTNDPTMVTVAGCVDDTHWQLYNSKGQLVDSGPSGPRPTSAQIDRNSGVWKVSSLAIQGVGTCSG
jgi:predicted lipid-binding transport protein (Tim44 family)